MSKVNLAGALAALGALVVAGVMLNRPAPAHSGPGRPPGVTQAPGTPDLAAAVAKRTVMLQGVGMARKAAEVK